MSNMKVSVEIDAKAINVDSVRKKLKSIDEEIIKIEKSGENMQLGQQLRKNMDDISSQLKQIEDMYNKAVKEMSNQKIDTTAFDNFTKTVTVKTDEVFKRLAEVEQQVSNVSKTLSTFKGGDKLTKSLDYIRSTMKDFKKDTQGAIDTLRNLNDVLNIDRNNKSLAELDRVISKLSKIDLYDTKNIAVQDKSKENLKALKDELVGLTDSYTDYESALKKSTSLNETMKIQKEMVENLKRTEQVLRQITAITGGSSPTESTFSFKKSKNEYFISDIANDTVSNIENLQRSLGKARTEIVETAKALGQTAEATVASFKFEDGGIKIPVILDQKAVDELKPNLQRVINDLSAYSENNPVNVTLRLFSLNGNKDTQREVDKELKDLQVNIAKVNDPKLKESFNGLFNNLEKQYRKGLEIEVTATLSEQAKDIVNGIKAIQKEVKKESIVIHPTFEITESEETKLQNKIKELREGFTFNITNEIKEMAVALKALLETNNIKEWTDTFAKGLDELNAKITPLKELVEAFQGVSTINGGKKSKKDSTPTTDDLNVILLFTESLTKLQKVLSSQKGGDAFDPLVKSMDAIKDSIDEIYAGLGSVSDEIDDLSENNIINLLQRIEECIKSIGAIHVRIDGEVDGEDFVSSIERSIPRPVRVPVIPLINGTDSFVAAIENGLNLANITIDTSALGKGITVVQKSADVINKETQAVEKNTKSKKSNAKQNQNNNISRPKSDTVTKKEQDAREVFDKELEKFWRDLNKWKHPTGKNRKQNAGAARRRIKDLLKNNPDFELLSENTTPLQIERLFNQRLKKQGIQRASKYNEGALREYFNEISAQATKIKSDKGSSNKKKIASVIEEFIKYQKLGGTSQLETNGFMDSYLAEYKKQISKMSTVKGDGSIPFIENETKAINKNTQAKEKNVKATRQSVFDGITDKDLQKEYKQLEKNKKLFESRNLEDVFIDSEKDQQELKGIENRLKHLMTLKKKATELSAAGNDEDKTNEADAKSYFESSQTAINNLVKDYGVSENLFNEITKKSEEDLKSLSKEILAFSKNQQVLIETENRMKAISQELDYRKNGDQIAKNTEETKKQTKAIKEKTQAQKEAKQAEKETATTEQKAYKASEKKTLREQIKDVIAAQRNQGKINFDGIEAGVLQKIFDNVMDGVEKKKLDVASGVNLFKEQLSNYRKNTQQIKEDQKDIQAEQQSTNRFLGLSEDYLQQCLDSEEKWLARCKEGSAAYEKRKKTIEEINEAMGKSAGVTDSTAQATALRDKLDALKKEKQQAQETIKVLKATEEEGFKGDLIDKIGFNIRQLINATPAKNEEEAQKLSGIIVALIKRVKKTIQKELNDNSEFKTANALQLSLAEIFQDIDNLIDDNTIETGKKAAKYGQIIIEKLAENGLDVSNYIGNRNQRIDKSKLESFSKRIDSLFSSETSQATDETPDSSTTLKEKETQAEVTTEVEKQIEALRKEQSTILETVDVKNRDKLSTLELVDAYEKLRAIYGAISKLGGYNDVSWIEDDARLQDIEDYLLMHRNTLAKAKSKNANTYWYDESEVADSLFTGAKSAKDKKLSSKPSGEWYGEEYIKGILSTVPKSYDAGAEIVTEGSEKGTQEAQKSNSPSVVADMLGQYWGIGYAQGIRKHKDDVEAAVRELVNTGILTTEDLQKDLDTLLSGGFGNKYKQLETPLKNVLGDYDKSTSRVSSQLKSAITRINKAEDLSPEQLEKYDANYAKWIQKAEELGMDVSEFQNQYSTARAKFGKYAEDSLGQVDESLNKDLGILAQSNQQMANLLAQLKERGKLLLGDEDVDVIQQTRIKETKEGQFKATSYKVTGKSGSVTLDPKGNIIATKQNISDDFTRRQEAVKTLVKEMDKYLSSILEKEIQIGVARTEGDNKLADSLTEQVERDKQRYEENRKRLEELGEEEILQNQLVKNLEAREKQEDKINKIIASRLDKEDKQAAKEAEYNSFENKWNRNLDFINSQQRNELSQTIRDRIDNATGVNRGDIFASYHDKKGNWLGALADEVTEINSRYDVWIGKYDEIITAQKEVDRLTKLSEDAPKTYAKDLEKANDEVSRLKGELRDIAQTNLFDKLTDEQQNVILNKEDILSAIDKGRGARKEFQDKKDFDTKQKNLYDELGSKVNEYINLRKEIAKGKGFDEDVQKVEELIDNIVDLNERIKENGFFNGDLEQNAMKGLDTIDAEVSRIETEVAQKQQEKLSKTFNGLSNRINSSMNDIQFEIDYGNHTEEFNDRLKKIHTTLKDISSIPVDVITEDEVNQAQVLLEEVRKIRKEGKLSANNKANENSLQKSLAQINSILSSNTKMSFRRTDVYKDLIRLQNEFKNFDTSKPQSELADLTKQLLQTKTRFEELENSVKGQNLFQTFLERIHGTTAQLIAQYLSFQDIIRYARTAINSIVELDTALVDLRKTTSMNNSELEGFYYESNNVAKQLGVTTAEVIQQASSWSRLGYSTKEAATTMAELSSQFASISPGTTVEDSTDYLVSTMQAFGIATDEVERKIMDNVNAIGKKLPKHTVMYGVMYIT